MIEVMTKIIFVAVFFAAATSFAKPSVPSKTPPPAELPAATATKDLAGLRLLKIQDGSVYAKLGFKNNDVITSVDGKSVESIEELDRLFQSKKPELTVEVIRDGKPETFRYQMK